MQDPKASRDASEKMHSVASSLALMVNRPLGKDTSLSFVISWKSLELRVGAPGPNRFLTAIGAGSQSLL